MFFRHLATRLLIFVGLIFAGTVPARAASIRIVPCVLRATPDMTARSLFAQPERFDCATPQDRLGGGDFWLLSQRLPPASAAMTDMVSASTWQDRTALHVLYADSAIRTLRFSSRDAGRHLRLGALVGLAIPHRSSPPIRLLWHIQGATNLRGLLLAPALADRADGARLEVRLAGAYGMFAGMALAMLVCNLALWAALRQAFQPAYCVLMALLICYVATSSGALGEWLPGFDNNDRLRLNAVFLGASATAVIFFARTFFEPAVFAGWLGRTSIAVGVAVTTSNLTYAVLAPWHARLFDDVVVASFVAMMLLVPAILWRAWRVRSNYLWLFSICWGVPIAFAGLRVANALSLIPWNFWVDHSTILSMALEAMLSSTAIAYRIYLLSRERDQARARELLALELADVDPLTGLLNRRAFLSRAIGRSGEHVLLLADIDHFKSVNDTIGHDGGDEVLRVFARALHAAVPADALVSRFGGEEFAIVVEAGTDLVAADILARLRSERMPYDLRVTASIGTCTGRLEREADWKSLYRCADKALFDAKASGRDRIRVARIAA